MTYLARIDVDRMSFGTSSAQRVTGIRDELERQRTNRRNAANASDRDVAERNVADLEGALERAEANEAARQQQAKEREDAVAAQRKERDDAALAALTDQLRVNFLSQPGATAAEFERVLPGLLSEHRSREALQAPERQRADVAEARRRIGRFV